MAQVTETLVTFALPTVPVPFATVQVCEGEAGCVATVTAYAPPAATAFVKVAEPLPDTMSVSEPLFESARPDPESPETLTPIM